MHDGLPVVAVTPFVFDFHGMGVGSFGVDEAMGGDADDVAAAATAAASPYIGPRRFPMAGVEDVLMSAILSRSGSFVNTFMDTNLAMQDDFC